MISMILINRGLLGKFMAKKSTYYPVVRKFDVNVRTTPAAAANAVVLVDRELSAVNNRLYRQHRVYQTKVDLATSGNYAQINVMALAPTWWVMNAIKKAKAHFDLATKEEASQSKARWYDFRISTGLAAATAEVLDAKLAPDAVGGLVSPTNFYGEYVYSDVHCSDGNDRIFTLNGASSLSQYNIFEEYDRMGQTVVDPPSANSGGYTDLTESIDNENVQHLTGDGNAPPYDADDFPSAMWIRVGTLFRDANGNQVTSTGFFDAPLGIIGLQGFDGNVMGNLSVTVQKGDYKGVLGHAC
jgi:hypothetical protein